MTPWLARLSPVASFLRSVRELRQQSQHALNGGGCLVAMRHRHGPHERRLQVADLRAGGALLVGDLLQWKQGGALAGQGRVFERAGGAARARGFLQQHFRAVWMAQAAGVEGTSENGAI